MPFAKRFTSDSLLYIDATFRTNRHGLLLIIAAGATNTNRTILVAFSQCLEEDAQSYKFFAKTLREEIYSDCLDLAVVLANQGAGLTSAFARGCFLDLELEYYSQHAIRAIIIHFRATKGYTKNDIQGYIDPVSSQAIAGLKGHCQNYIQSNS